MTREEAIKVLEMFLYKQCDLERTKFAYDQLTVWDAVNMASEALKQSEPQWTPVSERLPENDKPVLICTTDGWETAAQYDEDYYRCTATKWEWHDNWGDYHHIEDIVAWMPLPESYRGEENGTGSI